MTSSVSHPLLDQAREELKQGNMGKAAQLAQSVRQSVEQGSELYVLALTELLDLALKQHQFGEAGMLADEIIERAGAFALRHGLSQAYLVQGILARRKGDMDEALRLIGLARAEAEALSDKKSMANALAHTGATYRSIGSYREAIDCLSVAIELHEESGNTTGLAQACGSIGLVYDEINIHDKALEYHTKALAIHEAAGDASQTAGTLANIGNFYWTIGDNSKALEYSRKALPLAEQSGNHVFTANILVTIGNIYRFNKEYSEAIEYFDKGLTIFKAIDHSEGITKTIYSSALLNYDLGHYTEALDQFYEVLELHTKSNNKKSIALVHGAIGKVYAQHGFDGFDPQVAEEYLLKAIELNTSLGAQHQLHIIHQLLYQLYKQTGNLEKSLFHLEQHHILYDKLKGEQVQNQAVQFEHRRKVEEGERDRQVKLARLHEQERILHNILPLQIADRMVSGETTIADSYPAVSVFFSDIVGFTKLSQQVSAGELVHLLNGVFSEFDRIARKHGLEKIKTIGDAYMAVAGAPIAQDDHAERAALFALDVIEAMNTYRTHSGSDMRIRIGLHSGAVVAGIIGESKFSYDLWGDTVNTASRMESHGEPGRIHVSEEFVRTLERVQALPQMHDLNNETPSHREKTGVAFVSRGEMEIKGKGMMRTYFLEKA